MPYLFPITDNNTANSSTSYFRLSGTSMAAPIVSGAADCCFKSSLNLHPTKWKAADEDCHPSFSVHKRLR